jgi:hypothetical protein
MAEGEGGWGGGGGQESEPGSLSSTPGSQNVQVFVRVRPFLPQARVGIVTDDRWTSEQLQHKIEDSGDSMSEFVELGFETAGLEWPEPPVEHYREQAAYFYFATPLDLSELTDVSDEAVRRKVLQMLEGYYHAFGREC